MLAVSAVRRTRTIYHDIIQGTFEDNEGKVYTPIRCRTQRHLPCQPFYRRHLPLAQRGADEICGVRPQSADGSTGGPGDGATLRPTAWLWPNKDTVQIPAPPPTIPRSDMSCFSRLAGAVHYTGLAASEDGSH